jgi:hypothetical protein
MLGQSGSNPLELFWDELEKLDIDFRLKRDYVLDVLEVHTFKTFLTAGKTLRSLRIYKIRRIQISHVIRSTYLCHPKRPP